MAARAGAGQRAGRGVKAKSVQGNGLTTVAIESKAGSTSFNDITLEAKIKGVVIDTQTLTVLQPAVDTAWGPPLDINGTEKNNLHGFETFYALATLDQFGRILPRKVPAHEQFATVVWISNVPAPGVSTWDHLAGALSDNQDPAWHGDGYTSDPDGTPAGVHPGAAGANDKVDHNTQSYWIGSTTNGKGIQTKIFKIQFYRGKARQEAL